MFVNERRWFSFAGGLVLLLRLLLARDLHLVVDNRLGVDSTVLEETVLGFLLLLDAIPGISTSHFQKGETG